MRVIITFQTRIDHVQLNYYVSSIAYINTSRFDTEATERPIHVGQVYVYDIIY